MLSPPLRPALPPVHQDHLREPAGIGGCREQRGPGGARQGLPDHQPGPAECHHPGHRSGEERSAGGEREPRFFDLLYYCDRPQQRSPPIILRAPGRLFHSPLPPIATVSAQRLAGVDQAAGYHDEEPQTGFSVLNNACWSCGEIAVHEKVDLSPYLDRLYQGL